MNLPIILRPAALYAKSFYLQSSRFSRSTLPRTILPCISNLNLKSCDDVIDMSQVRLSWSPEEARLDEGGQPDARRPQVLRVHLPPPGLAADQRNHLHHEQKVPEHLFRHETGETLFKLNSCHCHIYTKSPFGPGPIKHSIVEFDSTLENWPIREAKINHMTDLIGQF